MNRRRFLQSIGAGSTALYLSACSDDVPATRYNQQDKDQLAQQRLDEARLAGSGEYGAQRYQGYRGLSRLPWFDLNDQGRLICTDATIPRAIDIHSHLGMSVLFSPNIDLNQPSKRVKHLLDCDDPAAACELDLDVYANGNFTQDRLATMQSEVRAQGLWGSEFARTQTIPNLLQEMDDMRVEQAVLLPIKVGLWFGDDLTEQWRKGVDQAQAQQRLHVGFSIDPTASNRLQQFDQYVASGAKIVKLHPTVQRFYPDDSRAMEIYQRAKQHNVIIFFHGGRAGIEPESSHPYAMPRHYRAPLAEFPEVQFILGHAGARDHHAMFALARDYDNAWIGTHGQSIQNLENMIAQTGGQRLLFGTDWPFYHIGMSLAKVLITTQGERRRSIRQAILRDNAVQLFGRALTV
ncbi:amidohydrolase family protein [Arenicella xantha]|uniref:Amidohydrolase-related domain-containing protein n=1 Tax=Arenicella xantha TaxID=644221 RepID=A0A395JFU1_9GAMM|nr:amidohydrolase family protein [Arenicella xantha]RBP48716.1 hypothetical protein DFR28_10554 [Arenicella xantha]